MKSILFLASGRGSNFQSFVDHIRLDVLRNLAIKGLISNHGDARALMRARDSGIETFEIEGVAGKKFQSKEERDKARLAFDNECIEIARGLQIDYIVLAGFDQILTKKFTDSFPYRIVNIHPAYDLKLFGGQNMVGARVHEMVLAQNMKYSGCTVHLVVPSVDQGPAIVKKMVDVMSKDSPESLAARVLEQEHLAFPEALQLLVDGRVNVSNSGTRCFVDRYSGNWDIEWTKRQQAYVEYVKKQSQQVRDE